jgi:hypothetical protein
MILAFPSTSLPRRNGMKLGAKIFGMLSGLLLLYLLLGLLLPGRWEAEAEAVIQASPEELFPLLNNLEAWARWSPMPESGQETFGSVSGVGAGLRWDDPQYGVGEVRIISSQANAEVGYEVEVEGGALKIQGLLTLEGEERGTRISWRESGDFGWNPLMGFAARGMASSQGDAMRESLTTLGQLVAR